MLDSILFERQGVPSVPIITTPFVPTARAIAKLNGLPEYGYVDVPHPITSLDEPELRERAKLAAPRIAAVLLGTV